MGPAWMWNKAGFPDLCHLVKTLWNFLLAFFAKNKCQCLMKWLWHKYNSLLESKWDYVNSTYLFSPCRVDKNYYPFFVVVEMKRLTIWLYPARFENRLNYPSFLFLTQTHQLLPVYSELSLNFSQPLCSSLCYEHFTPRVLITCCNLLF